MKGKIYRLYNSECCYIGSTTQILSQRKANHKCSYKRWVNEKKQDWVSSFILYMFDEEVHIELLEEIDFEDRKILLKLEQSYIDKYRDDCVNQRECGTDKKEYKSLWNKNNKEWKHQWYLDNKERICKKINCECGSIFRTVEKCRHLKTKKHIDYINSL